VNNVMQELNIAGSEQKPKNRSQVIISIKLLTT
jgi:hypothetical protein